MSFANIFKTRESLLSVDIGSSGIKLVELDTTEEKPKLVNIGLSPISGDVFSSNVISQSEKVAERITALLDANGIAGKRVVTSVPAPSVFTKRVKMPKQEIDELTSNLQFEAANFIPHNIDAVKLDFHIIGASGKNQLDVLVVAVKNEIIDSFLNCISLSGLETAVVDVDSFALQNIFELGYPELMNKCVALINMGARYSSINVCRDGQSLFSGDISIGGKYFTDSIIEGLGVTPEEAETYKKSKEGHAAIKDALADILDRNIDYVASELNRQLSFFWNASGTDGGIDRIMVTGGGSLISGLVEEIGEKTGIVSSRMDCFKGIDTPKSFDRAYLEELEPFMAVALGMGIREPGDRVIPEWEEGEEE